jgi:hypothetical protein
LMHRAGSLQLHGTRKMWERCKRLCTLKNHALVHTIAEEVEIYFDSCHTTLSNGLKMHHVCQHIVSRVLKNTVVVTMLWPVEDQW